jgi:hypothetical protein
MRKRGLQETWPEQRQIVGRDATARMLVDSGTEHAFQYLWENRLGQAARSLQASGRPISGGGLRIVMAPVATEDDPKEVEVKVESFLRDTSKVCLETVMRWPKPIAGPAIDPDGPVSAVEQFTYEQVMPFLEPPEGDKEPWE